MSKDKDVCYFVSKDKDVRYFVSKDTDVRYFVSKDKDVRYFVIWGEFFGVSDSDQEPVLQYYSKRSLH